MAELRNYGSGDDMERLTCPQCGSDRAFLNPPFGWKCENCSAHFEASPDVCPTCGGDRMVPQEFDGYNDCPTCGGSGYV